MKIKMHGSIHSVKRVAGTTTIELSFTGKVEEPVLSTGKEAGMSVELVVKDIVANKLKMGSKFTIVLTDEEETV